jgi:galactose mutarotase-like enzyme
MPYRQVSVAGFPAIALRSEDIEIVVAPTLGAKITNMRRLPGREWLWRNDQIPLTIPNAGASYVETSDSGGWDECFPNVGPSPVPGNSAVILPDHGELWSATWESRVYELNGASAFVSTAQGVLFPYEFHREVLVDHHDPVIHFRYRLRHTADASFPYIWSAHPLFNVQPGTTVTLPSVHEMRVDTSYGRAEERDHVVPWPLDGATGSMTLVESPPFAMKLFADIGPSGRAILTDPRAGERLEFVIPSAQVPQVGLWINCCGWAPEGRTPYYNLGLEPCIGAPDRLDDAVERWHAASTLAAGEMREWGFDVWLLNEGEKGA